MTSTATRADTRALLETIRYLWRGTRWRPSAERVVPGSVAGYVVRPTGEQRSLPEVASAVAAVVNELDLSDQELLVLGEYFGLSGYPRRLVGGPDALTGVLAAPSDRLSPRAASRSTVTDVTTSAVGKLAEALEVRVAAPHRLQPEREPSLEPWVRSPECLGRPLTPAEYSSLLSVAHELAFDLLVEAGVADEVRRALHLWARDRLGVCSPEESPDRLRPEYRNAAHAVLATTLWELTRSRETLDPAVEDDAPTLWPGPLRLPTGGRVAVHPNHGAFGSNLNADQLVLLAGEVMEGRDDGRGVSLILDHLLSAREPLHDADTSDTLVYALGRGLAAQNDWQVVELARWYQSVAPDSATLVTLVAWAANVASHHQHDGYAWRLCATAERLAESASPGSSQGKLWQVELVRSGCRVREAARWSRTSNVTRASSALREAAAHLRRAEASTRPASPTRWATEQLRQIEILLVAHDAFRQGAATLEVRHPLRDARAVADRLASVVERQTGEIDVDDLSMLHERLSRSVHAIEVAELDDSPPTS